MTRAAGLHATLLATTLLFGATAHARDQLVPFDETLRGRTFRYAQNLSRLAVFGTAGPADFAAALGRSGVVLQGTRVIRDVTVLALGNPAGGAITGADLEGAAAAIRALPGGVGTGAVFFTGEALVVPTGRVWVYLPAGTGPIRARARLHALGLVFEDYVEAVGGIAIGRPSTRASIEAVAAGLRARGVEAAPERMRQLRPLLVPDDPYYAEQWYLDNTGANVVSVFDGSPLAAQALADIRAAAAWDVTTGASSTIVGVLDSGTDCDHPELAGKCVDPYNAITDTPSAQPPDPAVDPTGGHGTAVAGIAVAPIDGTGVVGVCPACRVAPVRLIERATFLTDLMMLRAFQHAVDAGASVINNSWGPATVGEHEIPVGQGELEGLRYAGAGRGGRGVLVVYAAGNENGDTRYLGHLTTGEPNIMAVAASNQLDRRSVYSNFGVALDVAAPTNDMYLCPAFVALEITGAGSQGGDYTFEFGGTSAAAPIVSGVAALILTVAPERTAAEVRAILRAAADKIDPDGGFWDASGRSPLYGSGRVNARRALLLAQGLADPACDAPTAESCQTHDDENCDGYVDEGCSAATVVGTRCTAAAECGAEDYWRCPQTGRVRGTCTFSCAVRPCPAGTACVQGSCAPYCDSAHSCPSPSEIVCTDEVLGVCLLRCVQNTDCPTGEACDVAVGYCRLETDGLPGSPCTMDECVGAEAMCLTPGMGFPGGYCSHVCADDSECEEGRCLPVQYGNFCYRSCSFDGDCRPSYVCEQAGPRAGTCYKKCDKDSQCRGTASGWESIVCELATGRCVDSAADAGVADDAGATPGDDGPAAPDAGPDAGAPEPTPEAGGGSECGCAARSAAAPSPVGLLVLAALIALASRPPRAARRGAPGPRPRARRGPARG